MRILNQGGSMFRFKLVMTYGDDLTGEEGLLPVGWDWATPTPLYSNPHKYHYRGLAHDLIEHMGEQNGTVEDELRAFGAAIFGRYNMGTSTSAINLGIEIGSSINNYIERPKHTRVCEEVLEIQDQLWEGILKESRHILTVPLKPKDKRPIMHWISKGFMQAQRRYKSSDCMVNLYESVTRQLHEALRFTESPKAVYVTVDIPTEIVHVRVKEHVYD